MKGHVVVIGGGSNGLTAAALLAKGGCRVTLLERRPALGGLSAGEAFHPGFASPGLLHDSATLRPAVVRALDLEHFGLRFAPARPSLALERGGAGLMLGPDADSTALALEERSPADAKAFREWRGLIERLRPFVSAVLSEPPPELAPKNLAAGLDLLKRGVSLRRLGEADMLELMRVAPMAVADWMKDTFETERLHAALSLPALSGTWLGPWSAGSAACLLALEATRGRSVAGGPKAVVQALEACARQKGVQIQTETEAVELVVRGETVQGVRLASGETLVADAVLSTVDPKQTFLELVPARTLSSVFEDAVLNWRTRGTTAKVHLALDGLPEHPALAASSSQAKGATPDRMSTGASIDELERAFDAIKYGEMSNTPVLDIALPSLDDPTLAPEGKAVLSILAHYVPFELEGGWTAEAERTLEERVLTVLEEHLPGTQKRILATETLSPADIAERYRVSGGHVHHGEHALDQLLILRPNGDCAHYATPLAGLFLGGSGSHPGGGVTCAPGMLAAERILAN